MANPSIKGEVTMNSKPARRGLEEVESAVRRVGRTFSAVSKAGVALITIAGLKKAARAILDYARDIREVALQYGLTTDQAQKLLQLSSQTGVPVSTLAEKFAEAGMRIGESVDKMEQLRDAVKMTNDELGNVAKFDSAFKSLIGNLKAAGGKFIGWTATSKVGQALFPQIARLTKAGVEPPKLDTNVENKMAQAAMKPVVEKQASEQSRSIQTLANRANELQRIGAFSGIQNPILQINKQQLDELRKLNEKVAKGQFVMKESIYS